MFKETDVWAEIVANAACVPSGKGVGRGNKPPHWLRCCWVMALGSLNSRVGVGKSSSSRENVNLLWKE